MGEGAFCSRMGRYAWKVGCTDLDLLVSALTSSIDSIEGMKNALPGIRKKLNTDPVYFKRVYMHTFDLAKKEGARTLALDTGKLPFAR